MFPVLSLILRINLHFKLDIKVWKWLLENSKKNVFDKACHIYNSFRFISAFSLVPSHFCPTFMMQLRM